MKCSQKSYGDCKKQIKQGCLKQSCLKSAFFTEIAINQRITLNVRKGQTGRFLKHGQIEFVRMVVQQTCNHKKFKKLQASGQFVRTNSICPCYFFKR